MQDRGGGRERREGGPPSPGRVSPEVGDVLRGQGEEEFRFRGGRGGEGERGGEKEDDAGPRGGMRDHFILRAGQDTSDGDVHLRGPCPGEIAAREIGCQKNVFPCQGQNRSSVAADCRLKNCSLPPRFRPTSTARRGTRQDLLTPALPRTPASSQVMIL